MKKEPGLTYKRLEKPWIKLKKTPSPEVIKLFSSSAQLSMKFRLLINTEIVKISGKFRFKTKNLVNHPAHKC